MLNAKLLASDGILDFMDDLKYLQELIFVFLFSKCAYFGH